VTLTLAVILMIPVLAAGFVCGAAYGRWALMRKWYGPAPRRRQKGKKWKATI